MTQFTVPWQPNAEKRPLGFAGKAGALTVVLLLATVAGQLVTSTWCGGHPVASLLLVVGPLVTAGAVLLAIPVVQSYRVIGAMLFQFALQILIGGVIATGLAIWIGNVFFAWVSVDLVAWADDPAVSTLFGGPLTFAEISRGVSWLPGFAVALIWPIQFPLVRDLFSMGLLVGLFNLVPIYTIWWERKVAGRIQSRVGPMRVGGWHGWAQSFADGIKLILKEDLIPAGADGALFRVAPYFAVIPAALAFAALPIGATYVFRELDVGLLFVLGVLGIEVFGVILAGWASNNKWSVYGAMREVCQMVSYEIPMGMALLVPVLSVGSLSLVSIGEAQSGGWFSWLAFRDPFMFAAFVSYFIASLASCKRAPFDLPEAESELVAGFHTEYSGIRWSFFFFAEYAAMFVVSALAAIVFLGAWHSPLPASWGAGWGDTLLARGARGILFSGPAWLIAKCGFFLYLQLWIRWTLPRIRIDQVLYGCVQVLLPLTMVLLLGEAHWVWADESNIGGWTSFAAVANGLLGVVGAFFALMFPAIAMYGFYHRRRLVGNLVSDVMPGS